MTMPDFDYSMCSWPELLAAYADGELDGATRQLVEARLRESFHDRELLCDQEAFSPRSITFVASSRLELPSSSTWVRVWNRIDRHCGRIGIEPTGNRGRSWRRGLLSTFLAVSTMTAAAAVIAACWPTHLMDRSAPQRTREAESEGVFPVIVAGEVEIHSIREADVPHLVVGKPPEWNELSLVNSGEVRVDGMKPAVDGKMPEMQMGGWTDAPLIYAPVSRTP